MNITMNDALGFQGLYEKLKDQKISIKLAFKLNTIFESIESKIKFYNSEFQKIIEQYGQKDDNGNFVFINDGRAVKIKEGLTEECQAKTNELLELEVQAADVSFTLDELDDIELSISEVSFLMPFIKE